MKLEPDLSQTWANIIELIEIVGNLSTVYTVSHFIRIYLSKFLNWLNRYPKEVTKSHICCINIVLHTYVKVSVSVNLVYAYTTRI